MKKIFFVSSVFLFGMTSPLFATENMIACTREFVPVCGQPPMPECADGMMCAQVMPQPKTYANACLLDADKATQLYEGSCESSDNTLKRMKNQEFVTWAYDHKVTMFADIDDFGYNRPLSRQEAATFAVRFATHVLGKDVTTCTPKEATSSRSSLAHFYSDAYAIDETLLAGVDQACGMGIMMGADTFFVPDREMKKSEMLAVLIRAIQGKMDETKNPWYETYRNIAESLGLSLGEENLDTPITRGEAIGWMKIFSDMIEATSPTVLEGNWELQSVTGYSDSEVQNLGVILNFTGNRLGTKICNSLGGNFTLGEDATLNAPAIMSTLMYCEGSAGKIENDFVLDGAHYQINQNTSLVITTKEGIKFAFDIKPSDNNGKNALLGEWKLIGYNDLTFENIKKAGYENVKLTFDTGSISGKFCNSLGGEYTVDGSVLNTRGLVMTEMYCNDAMLMKMESSFALIDGAKWEHFRVNTFAATDEPYNRLRLTLKNGDVFTFGN